VKITIEQQDERNWKVRVEYGNGAMSVAWYRSLEAAFQAAKSFCCIN